MNINVSESIDKKQCYDKMKTRRGGGNKMDTCMATTAGRLCFLCNSFLLKERRLYCTSSYVRWWLGDCRILFLQRLIQCAIIDRVIDNGRKGWCARQLCLLWGGYEGGEKRGQKRLKDFISLPREKEKRKGEKTVRSLEGPHRNWAILVGRKENKERGKKETRHGPAKFSLGRETGKWRNSKIEIRTWILPHTPC